MDHPVVMTESEEGQSKTASLGGEEDLPLAQLPHNPRSKRRRKMPAGKAENRLKTSEAVSETIASNRRGKFKRSKKTGASVDGKYTETRSPAMLRAEEVQSNLEEGFPNFAKLLGLPGPFCKLHLPNKDTAIVLEDEFGNQFNIKYIADKTGLSAGWRQFVGRHNLVEGDVLVFQLIEPTKFKIYIIRANDFDEVDGALGLLTLDAPAKADTGKADDGFDEFGGVRSQKAKRRHRKSLPLAVVQEKNNSSDVAKSPSKHTGDQYSENYSNDVGSEILEVSKLPLQVPEFKDVTSFDNFKISVNGMVFDSEIPEDKRIKYHELCCCQNAFLHENLMEGIDSKLVVGTISETVNIASAIRACDLTTSRDEFTTWDKTLKAFELLGMKVGFLRARLHKLVNLAYENETAVVTRKYFEAKSACACAEDEIRRLESRLKELKEDHQRFCSDIDNLKSKAESYEAKFKEEVSAPW